MSGPLASTLRGIEAHGLFNEGERVLVGVSGGADSVALLRMLDHLVRGGRLHVELVVAHLDHALREESAEDAHFVQELARSMDLPVVCRRVDVPAVCSSDGIGIEQAARRCRYDFFRRGAVEHNCTKVATAHTLDDRAETVLMNLLRGSAADGLAGIPWRRPLRENGSVEVVRPLLEVSRAELTDYLYKVKQAWREDPSNVDRRFRRNDIRHEVLPKLEALYPNVRGQLARTAEFFAEVAEDIQRRCEAAWSDLVTCDPAGVTIVRQGLADLGPLIGKALLRRATVAAGAPEDSLGRDHLDRLWRQVLRVRRTGMDLPGGVRAEVVRGEVRLG